MHCARHMQTPGIVRSEPLGPNLCPLGPNPAALSVFTDEASVIRLAGAVLIDLQDGWQAAERPYFSEASMAKLAARDNDHAGVGELVTPD
jgi:hypothetical protein